MLRGNEMSRTNQVAGVPRFPTGMIQTAHSLHFQRPEEFNKNPRSGSSDGRREENLVTNSASGGADREIDSADLDSLPHAQLVFLGFSRGDFENVARLAHR